MYGFKNINRFDTPIEILECYRPDALDKLTDDEQEQLRSCCDFESIFLYVINDSIVVTVDAVDGDVLSQSYMSRFASESIAWARENA